MTTHWTLTLLGRVEVVRTDAEGRVCERRSFRPGQHTEILGLLSLPPGRILTRTEIIETLWPGIESSVGRNRLRQEIFFLRKLLEPEGVAPGSVLETYSETLSLRAEAVTTDVQQIEAALTQGKTALALSLWRGDLLPDLTSEWVLDERYRLNALRDEAERVVPKSYPVRREDWRITERNVMAYLALLPAGATREQIRDVSGHPNALPALDALCEAQWVTCCEERYLLPDWVREQHTPLGLPHHQRQKALHLLRWTAKAEMGPMHKFLVPDTENAHALLNTLLPTPDALQTIPAAFREDLISVLSMTVRALRNIARITEARCLGDRALALAPSLAPEHAMNLIHSVAIARIDHGTEAQALFERCFRIALAENLEVAACVQLRSMGIAAHHAEQDAEAIRCFEESLRYCRRMAQPSQECDTLMEFATSLAAQGRWEEARERLETALALSMPFVADATVRHCICRIRYGSVLCHLGETMEARRQADHALRLLLSLEHRNTLADAKRLLAQVALAEADYGIARLHALSAQQDYAQVGNEGAVIALEGLLGSFALAEGDFETARACFEKCWNYWKAKEHRRWMAECSLQLAEWAIAAGEFEEAHRWKAEALALCAQTNAPHLLRKAQGLSTAEAKLIKPTAFTLDRFR